MRFLSSFSLLLSLALAMEPPKITISKLRKSRPGYWRTYFGDDYFSKDVAPRLVQPYESERLSEALDHFERMFEGLSEARYNFNRIMNRISMNGRNIEDIDHVSSDEEEAIVDYHWHAKERCRRSCIKCDFKEVSNSFEYQLDVLFSCIMDDIELIKDYFHELSERCTEVITNSKDVQEVAFHRSMLPIVRERLDLAEFCNDFYVDRYIDYDSNGNLN